MFRFEPLFANFVFVRSPFEHGEVFVLDDGGETDLDLGNYERFLSVSLTKESNLSTGKIYQSVIERERVGDYLGKTVQVVPHISAHFLYHRCHSRMDTSGSKSTSGKLWIFQKRISSNLYH
mmetsp:Transcript_11687/g.16588  ORF Transcript_11687/g.16588 Transcript_11687/m.16588 type:complete len:121 (+) Transcript_11687:634-996(+)